MNYNVTGAQRRDEWCYESQPQRTGKALLETDRCNKHKTNKQTKQKNRQPSDREENEEIPSQGKHSDKSWVMNRNRKDPSNWWRASVKGYRGSEGVEECKTRPRKQVGNPDLAEVSRLSCLYLRTFCKHWKVLKGGRWMWQLHGKICILKGSFQLSYGQWEEDQWIGPKEAEQHWKSLGERLLY